MHRFRFRPVQELLKLIFPSLCCHCGEPLVGDEKYLCTQCLVHIPWAKHASYSNNDAELRLSGRIPFQAAAALLLFRKGNVAQTIIHQIKYHGNTGMANQYGTMLGMELKQSNRFNDIDYIVPVPLHSRRKRQRGYNQSELICEAVSKVFNRPVVANNLYRKQFTTSQTHKNRQDRMDNMTNVFDVRHPEQFENKHILLIDDIITTGATTENCYQALSSIPDLRISIAALAVTTS